MRTTIAAVALAALFQPEAPSVLGVPEAKGRAGCSDLLCKSRRTWDAAQFGKIVGETRPRHTSVVLKPRPRLSLSCNTPEIRRQKERGEGQKMRIRMDHAFSIGVNLSLQIPKF
jgi:hypothetical protein